MSRYGTIVEDGTVYIDTEDGLLEIGDLDSVIDTVGGHAWTIEYSEWEREEYEELDMSDHGLTVDVVDMMSAMTHSKSFVETLRAHPTETTVDDEDAISPRLGLFVGKLLENLETGLQ